MARLGPNVLSRALFLACAGPALVSCGGGSSSTASSVPAPAPAPAPAPSPAPVLSTAQTNYESVALAKNGGIHDMLWSLPASGAPTTANGNFFVDIASGGLANSPAGAGAQLESFAWTSLSASLTVPALPINIAIPSGTPTASPTTGPTVRLPDLVMQSSGVVVAASNTPNTIEVVSYSGNDIQVNTIAVDGTTVAYSTMISAVGVVSVAGQSVAAPSDPLIAAWLAKYSLLANVAPLVKSASTFAAGSAYVLNTATRKGDTLFVGDCALAETSISGATLVPCQTGNTLEGTGVATETTFYDGSGGTAKTYTLATDGSICEIAAQAAGSACPPFGVRYWVATNPRSPSGNVPAETVSYRVYYEQNSNVYSATLQRNGAVIGENVGSDAAPNIIPAYVRVNSTFAQSVKAALNF